MAFLCDIMSLVRLEMLFFCLFRKVLKTHLNYRGIVLASCVSKVLKWSIILTWSQVICGSDLSRGIRPPYEPEF